MTYLQRILSVLTESPVSIDFLFEVLDTIQQSNHLIILHHKLIWMYDHDVLESQISSVSNADLGGCFNCINPNNFYSEIYPKLVVNI